MKKREDKKCETCKRDRYFMCNSCRKKLCLNCIVYVNNKPYCKNCAVKLII